MRSVNDIIRQSIILLCFCAFWGVGNADSRVNKAPIYDGNLVLDAMLWRSSQVVIGRFDLNSVDLKNLNPNESVHIKFIAEKWVKGDEGAINEFIVPFPYNLFVLRTEKGRAEFSSLMINERAKLTAKKLSFLKGEISESEWLEYKNKWTKEFRSHKFELLLFNSISGGLDISFNSEVKYVFFFRNRIDSDYVDWNYVVSQRMYSLGSGTFADLLIESEA